VEDSARVRGMDTETDGGSHISKGFPPYFERKKIVSNRSNCRLELLGRLKLCSTSNLMLIQDIGRHRAEQRNY
jgi:hypothetical protein